MKRGSPLKRKRAMKRGPIESRRGGVWPVRPRIKPNAKRKAKKFTRNYHSSAFVKWTKRQPCATCGELRFDSEGEGLNVTSHVKARGNGGCGGTWRDTISQCTDCHAAFEDAKQTWPRLNGFDMAALAREHIARWESYVEASGVGMEKEA